MAFLNNEGLQYLWDKILNNFVRKRNGKDLSSNDFTDAHKSKVDSIPTVTADDNGKFLCVVDGAWAATTVPNAEEESF